ncbi:sugar phosphate permease [Brevibacterium sanguinis]|uniref:Sugar phosphate permease n=2 Tax=Brevibacterium TaxID=1696 RepID=A0A366IK99_9MICO|nr:sugar phosphate permease [Brevibacterium sanguinis]RBP71345.1 sugar phosphate permease [Brevibacterium celere]
MKLGFRIVEDSTAVHSRGLNVETQSQPDDPGKPIDSEALATADRLTFTSQEVPESGVKPNRKGIGKLRWGIAVLLFFGVLINYIDRSSIAVAEGHIREDFGLSAAEMGVVLSSFGWSYVLMQIPAGLLLDKIGIKWVFRIATIMWSLSCFLTAIISGTGLLILARIVLGVAEAPIFPGAMKMTGYWFPRSERGTATAVFDSGQRLSNVIGFPLVAAAVVSFGWRGAFVAMGLLSLTYVIVFFWKYRDPKESYRKGLMKETELTYIREGGAQDEDAPRPNPLSNLGYILKQRKVWGMSIGLGCAGYTQWMLLTWLPGYLQTEMGMNIMSSGIFTALPWLIAVAVEFIFPGWLLDHLMRLGKSGTFVRKAFIIAGMLIAMTVMGAAFTDNVAWALFWITLGTCGITISFCVTNSLPALIAPEGGVGATGSVMNTVNNLIGTSAPIVTGFVVDITGGFNGAFIICGILLAIGIFFYTVVLGPIVQIPTAEERRAAKPAAAGT